jgi:hypothetical protein
LTSIETQKQGMEEMTAVTRPLSHINLKRNTNLYFTKKDTKRYNINEMKQQELEHERTSYVTRSRSMRQQAYEHHEKNK